jgi:3-methyladenine DNA glycosylase AlkD
MFEEVKKEINRISNPERATHLMAYFKTGKGGYAADDVFIGLTVPQSRVIAKLFSGLPLEDTKRLLESEVHEERLIALFILISQYQKGDEETKKHIFDFYVRHLSRVNNWDLVDTSADKILGDFVYTHPEKDILLTKLVNSSDLWEKRVAMLSTFAYIKHGESKKTFEIAEILLHDKHDLIHKAVGWLLREVGKRVSREDLEAFLAKHYKTMPRTALRYAIEHFPEEKRKAYLQGRI